MNDAVGSLDALKAIDQDVYAAIVAEEERQRDKLLLIASENFASPAVLAAQGSLMTNKYAEGYPGKRYYGGCQHVDTVENLAIQRCKQIFGAEHVNVQPHSGSQANMAAYLSVLKPGDTILGMDLAQGGHLTHGSKVNFSGILFRVFSYGVERETETINYDAVQKVAEECRPRLLVVGASAYSRIFDFTRFQQQVIANAKVLAQGFLDRGYKIVSGGTDTHLMLMNLAGKGITGKEADAALDAAGIIVNKNAVPYDEKPPAVASGIRLGTPIVSTRGMREAEMKEIVGLVDRVLQHRQDPAVLEEVRIQAKALCSRFPIFHTY